MCNVIMTSGGMIYARKVHDDRFRYLSNITVITATI
jgi:hypothetical protein